MIEGYARDQFVREYVDLMDQERAMLFCGAGTSIPAGDEGLALAARGYCGKGSGSRSRLYQTSWNWRSSASTNAARATRSTNSS